MAYEHINRTGSIFKNTFKTEEKHPDYRGIYKDDQGKEWSVALWVKEGAKGKFFSMAMSEPQQRKVVDKQPQQITADKKDETDELPF